MAKNEKSVNYSDYLQLDKILNAVAPESAKYGEACHDETLFIIVHQVYELWFKQILHEVDSVIHLLAGQKLEESKLGTIVSRLERVIKIQKLLVDQLDVIETMTPMDFLDFRDKIHPASGFQSVQFKVLEVKLGLQTTLRNNAEREGIFSRLTEEDKKQLLRAEQGPSLFSLMESWLERTPFLNLPGFDFWTDYAGSVSSMLESDEKIIRASKHHTPEGLEFELQELSATREMFSYLFDEEKYQKFRGKKKIRLSQKATLAALFILLYRDEPILHLPYKFLGSLLDMDELFTTWRYRHAMLAQRMLGTKIGTGGSSGHQYLKATTEKNRVFVDLFNLSTFLIPRSSLPKLPTGLKEKLGYSFRND